jgi:hypothetical protein
VAVPASAKPPDQDGAVELEPERRVRVSALHDRLDDLTYYALLGVAPQAEKKQIKSAYYALAPDFHPDKYFRKNLGTYRQKIEAIFARITLAHDVLTDRARRAEYDAYLEQTQKNAKMSSVFDDSPPDVTAILAAVEQAAARAIALAPPPSAPSQPAVARPSTASMPVPGAPLGDRRPSTASMQVPGAPLGDRRSSTPSMPVPGAPLGDRRPSTPSMPVPGADRRPSSGAMPAVTDTPLPPGISPEEALRLRREALARKLAGGARRPTPAPTPTAAPAPRPSVPAMSVAELERAAEALRARREAALAEAKREQVKRLLDAGAAAMAQEDYAASANSYRLAASVAPDDAAVQATCADALQKAMAALADGYWKQAAYEEGQERWSDAALSYSRVCTGQPGNALAHERVAFATLKAAGNARRAVDFARRAVELQPKKPDYHVTLARAYGAAGLEKSANGELDRALELAPGDPRVKALIASARTALSPKGREVS